ncbi:MAG: hypothetical protein ACOYMS_14755 [Terrimicrobiaceae bacterium]
MTPILKRSLILIAVVGALAVVALWARGNGLLPEICDTNDVSYEKLCGITPTSGIVWCWISGWGSGYAFYRLHLKRSDFNQTGHTPLLQRELANMPKAPWWWGTAPAEGVTYKRGGGLGQGTASYEVYSKSTETLYVCTEWD